MPQRNSQKVAFNDFCLRCKELKDLDDQEASLPETAGKLEDAAFSISVETSLVRDIKDIIDELSCVDYILHRQEDVVASLTRSQKSRSLKTVAEIVKERRDTWASIAKTAHVAYEEIKTQMDVKQKQANLSETRSSRHQASLPISNEDTYHWQFPTVMGSTNGKIFRPRILLGMGA
jgi:hypothetical protein